MTSTSTVGIIVASARPNRVGESVARWVIGAVADQARIDLIDLREVELPPFDEPASPREGKPPVHPHTRDWAERIGRLDAAIIISPQYNGSYPGALKNAVDYLYSEWSGLPVLLVAYGWIQAREVLGHLSELLSRVHADVVGALGLGFREDLAVDGELSITPQIQSRLETGIHTLLDAAERKAPAEGPDRSGEA